MTAAHGFKPAFGHTEPRRGAECWGEDLFGYFWVPPKVTRCKSGTIGGRYLNNGYVHPPKKTHPQLILFPISTGKHINPTHRPPPMLVIRSALLSLALTSAAMAAQLDAVTLHTYQITPGPLGATLSSFAVDAGSGLEMVLREDGSYTLVQRRVTLSQTTVSSTEQRADSLPPVYSGGQVAVGGRLGMLGNSDVMDAPFSVSTYTAALIKDQQATTVTDLLGRHVKVNLPVQRVILGEGRQLHLVAALDTHNPIERIVGWRKDLIQSDPDTYNAYLRTFPAIAKIPTFGGFEDGTFDIEQAISQRPDVIILNIEAQHAT